MVTGEVGTARPVYAIFLHLKGHTETFLNFSRATLGRKQNGILNINSSPCNCVCVLVFVLNERVHVWRHQSLRFPDEKGDAQTMNLRLFVSLKEHLAHCPAPLCVCVCVPGLLTLCWGCGRTRSALNRMEHTVAPDRAPPPTTFGNACTNTLLNAHGEQSRALPEHLTNEPSLCFLQH